MYTSMMGPVLRPTIIVVLGETGNNVYKRLLNLNVGLDTVSRLGIAIVRYGGVKGSSSERLRLVLPENDDAYGAFADPNDRAADDTVQRTGPFDRMIIDALCDVQDMRTVERIQQAGIKTPDPLTQFVVVAKADDPFLGDVLEASRAALRTAARELGAAIQLDAPIFCALADYGSLNRDFYRHVDTKTRDQWRRSPEESDVLEYFSRSFSSNGAHDPAENLGALQHSAAAIDKQAQDLLAKAIGVAPANDEGVPAATFQFLYTRLRQDTRVIMREDLVQYIMAEAIFALAVTGKVFALAMADVTRVLPYISATQERIGGLGACMMRFPRAEAEKYCMALLSADLLDYWSAREQAAHGGDINELKTRMSDAAGEFVSLLTQWVRGGLEEREGAEMRQDIVEAIPDAPWYGVGWPDPDAFAESTLDAGKALAHVRWRMDSAIARSEIDKLIEERDPTGDIQREPDQLAELWREVTTQAWLDYEDMQEAQWPGAAASAYRGISDELKRFLDRYVDDIWLHPEQGWKAASAYADALSESLYDIALETLAHDRLNDDANYERLLHIYEERIEEAYRDDRLVDLTGDGDPHLDPADNGTAVPTNQGQTIPGDTSGAADTSGFSGGASPGDTFFDPDEDVGDAEDEDAVSYDQYGGYAPGDDLTGTNPPPASSAPATPLPDPPAPEAEDNPDEAALPPTREEREQRVLDGMNALVSKRLLDQRVMLPAIGLSITAAPVLTLIVLSLLTAWAPLSPVSALVAALLVAGILGALSVGMWLRAHHRAETARMWHITLMNAIANRRRQDVEERLRVIIINEALTNAREMREHLHSWPERIKHMAQHSRAEALKISNDLFNGPSGYHDILIANGVRLLPPTQDARESADVGSESPLRPIYHQFSDDRTYRPHEPWHGSMEGILEMLRETFRTGPGGVIRMTQDEFHTQLKRFLSGHFRNYLQGDIGRISAALDPRRNPTANALWAEARDHASPPQGAPGADILFISGQQPDVTASVNLGVERSTQRILTHESKPHAEWLLLTTLRKGGASQ